MPQGQQQQLSQQLSQQLPPPQQQRPKSENQFVPNFEKQWTKSDDFQIGDGVDVYVDWARLLPDNTMYTKVFARVVDSNGKYPIQGQRGFASIDHSTQRNQFYGFKFEVRADKLNPTLLLLVSFETWDKGNGRPCFAGHSYFPLFMDKTNELPITDQNSSVRSLNSLIKLIELYSPQRILSDANILPDPQSHSCPSHIREIVTLTNQRVLSLRLASHLREYLQLPC